MIDQPEHSRPAGSIRRGRGNLVVYLADVLRERIFAEEYPAGTKLPSEARLTETFNVSRTVVREAIASLRSDGLVESRHGSGVFVLTTNPTTLPPFRVVNREKISSVIEMIELRAAVEVEAAGLASLRRSPVQEDAIHEAHQRFAQDAMDRLPTSDNDLAFHIAIADATNNVRFREFLELLGRNLIPRAALQVEAKEPRTEAYLNQIVAEHALIVSAISERQDDAARHAMRRHLKGSQQRYRTLLSTVPNT